VLILGANYSQAARARILPFGQKLVQQGKEQSQECLLATGALVIACTEGK